ncbi:ABC transporter ATP-binding protein/permease [Xanthobacter oligotrophicus]|uniref:ABC transporter ATP-binding protein/permease n=1 Tax=Xanthobacter oligotrophicus TaxID=2607286 RepID=A0ABW6ZZJ4_9HYPH
MSDANARDDKRLSDFLSRLRAPARRDLSRAYVFAFVAGLCVIAQAALAARLVDQVIFGHRPLTQAGAEIAGFLGAVALRALCGWAAERAGFAAAARVMRALRADLLDHVARLGPAGLSALRTGETVAALSAGIRAVEPYYTRYLPASMMAVVLPLAILVAVFPFDWVSGLIFLATAPIIPLFMILIGKGAEALNQRQWRALARMSGHLLDAVQGLATLKAFNATARMAQRVAEVADTYRRDTMAVLRVAFLSSLVLEFFATVSIALAAIFIGFRLLWGGMDFFNGLFILLLAPEFYQPLRAMGTAYHAKMEAIGAAERIVALADAPALADPGGSRAVPGGVGRGVPFSAAAGVDGAALPNPPPQAGEGADRAGVSGASALAGTLRDASDENALGHGGTRPITLRFEDVTLTFADGRRALDGITLDVPAGARVALVGASGAGKSSLLHLALGFVRPTSGRVLVNGVPLGDLNMVDWRKRIAYAGQRPRLFAGTLADNIAPGEAAPDPARLTAALEAAGLGPAVARLSGGLAARVGEGGAGFSGGEAHRLALARAFYRAAPFVALDEPTAHLDRATEAEVNAALSRLMAGRTALFAVHRLAQAAEADLVVVLDGGHIIERGPPDDLLAQGGAYASLARTGPGVAMEALA